MAEQQPRVSEKALAYFVKLVVEEEGETQRADFILDLRDERAENERLWEALEWCSQAGFVDHGIPEASFLDEMMRLGLAIQVGSEGLFAWGCEALPAKNSE